MEFETESKESVGRTISSASKFQKKQLAILIPMDDKDVERNPDFQTPFNGEEDSDEDLELELGKLKELEK